MTSDLAVMDYRRLRKELRRMRAAPFPDLKAIDVLVDQLEQKQLEIKRQHGLPGNNPLE